MLTEVNILKISQFVDDFSHRTTFSKLYYIKYVLYKDGAGLNFLLTTKRCVCKDTWPRSTKTRQMEILLILQYIFAHRMKASIATRIPCIQEAYEQEINNSYTLVT